jgi:uncharacterized protein YbjT (DUF2867 family)
VILVSGGTGLLGRQVVRHLTGRSLGVRVLTRDPAAAADLASGGVEIVQGDLRDATSVAAAVDGATTVVAAAHGFVGPRGISPATVDRDGNIRLIEAARAVGAHVVLMSVVGASPDSPMELFRMKHAAEQHLLASGTPATIVRATAFTELWIRIMRETAARGGRPLVFGRGQSLVNFVSVADVAALVDHVVDDPDSRGQVWEIGGPDNLTMNELARLVQEADGRTGAPRHIPRFMLHAIARTVGGVVPQLGRQARASLAIDAADHPFDSAPTRERFSDLPVTSVADVLGSTRPAS